MSLTSRVANLFSGSSEATQNNHDSLSFHDHGLSKDQVSPSDVTNTRTTPYSMAQKIIVEEEEEARPPYLHSMVAGGFGGTTGDLLMHSLDTVKTRQQGDPHVPPKYTTMASSYSTILRQEGLRRGLYAGWLPAMLGSFPGTIIFFGTYEYSKRHMIDSGITPQLAYLTSGFLADFAASFVYVPSEVLKTRLQLQGRYNNPWFKSGYNYRSTLNAAQTIVRHEGFSALFHGYKATIFRDLPFSALQFTFYEQGQTWARKWKKNRDIGLPLELATGGAAGGLAGVITCPLDVVKTRIQTQIAPSNRLPTSGTITGKLCTSKPFPNPSLANATLQPVAATQMGSPSSTSTLKQQTRLISTSSPSTHTPRPGCIALDTSSVVTGLKVLYKTEGIPGLFRGVGPRFVWTSVQSGCMLLLYQTILRQLEQYSNVQDDEW